MGEPRDLGIGLQEDPQELAEQDSLIIKPEDIPAQPPIIIHPEDIPQQETIIIKPEDVPDQEIIVIRPEEIPAHLSELKETDSEEIVCLDALNNIWVHLGVPVWQSGVPDDKDLKIRIPDKPYIFMAHTLTAIDNKHPKGIKFENVPVIFAHGGRRGDRWFFQNGQDVVQTVNAFDDHTRRNSRDYPPIQFVVACNKDQPSMIRVKDFSLNRPIVQVVGEVMFFNSGEMKDGRVDLTLSAQEFWGLDDLEIAQQIKVIKK